MGDRELRPLDLGELFDVSLDLYRRHPVAFIAIAAAVALPIEAVGAFVAVATNSVGDNIFSGHWFGASLFSLFATVLAAAACMRGIGVAYLGGTPRWRASVAEAARRPGSLFGLAAIFAIAVSIGCILLVLPGAWLTTVWAIAVPLFVFERRTTEDALATSKAMVRDRFWPVAGTLLLAWILTGLVHVAISAVLAPITLLPGASLAPFRFLLTFISNGVGTVLTAPFMAILSALLYFDISARRGELDPNALAEQVGCGDLGDVTARPPRDAPEVFRRHLAALVERKGKHLEDVLKRTKNVLHELTRPSAEGDPPLRFDDGQPVTILFTDLEGSTAIHQTLGDLRAREVLRRHDDAIRLAVSSRGGRVVKHTGDGLMACFSSATAAISAAVDVQRALAEGVDPTLEAPLRVRVGINAGDPIVEERDVFGIAVQVAARIVAVAAPCQILVSEAVRDLVGGDNGFEFADHGDVVLKGFHDPFHLFEVRWETSRAAHA